MATINLSLHSCCVIKLFIEETQLSSLTVPYQEAEQEGTWGLGNKLQSSPVNNLSPPARLCLKAPPVPTPDIITY